jgi:hypothetical protein
LFKINPFFISSVLEQDNTPTGLQPKAIMPYGVEDNAYYYAVGTGLEV